MSKTIELPQLLETKAYLKDNNINYGTPADFITPFTDLFQDIEGVTYSVNVNKESVTANQDESKNIGYGRVSIRAKIPGNSSVRGPAMILMYALDVGNPVLKVGFGVDIYACTNLCVFSAEDHISANLNVSGARDRCYNTLIDYRNRIMAKMERYERFLQILEQHHFNGRDEIEKEFGRLSIECMLKKTIGIRVWNYASKQMLNQNNKYAINLDGSVSAYHILNAMTQHVTDNADIKEQLDLSHSVCSLYDHLLGDNGALALPANGDGSQS